MLPFVCLSGGGFVHQWTANLQKTGYYCHLQRLLAPILREVKSGVLDQEDYIKKLALKFAFFTRFVLGAATSLPYVSDL